MSADQIKQKAEEVKNDLIKIRRIIHSHPELGFEEKETALLVAKTLEQLGIEVQTGVAKTGVVGILRGGKPGKTVALRGDMDALPIKQESHQPYRSQIEGKMHACGHDCHTTSLLGAAMILKSLQKDIPGNVKFIFQPAEESPGGAEPMINEGVLKNPSVDGIFGAHVWIDYPIGTVGVQYGPTLAAPDRFELEIIGKGGHGAVPHQTVDAIIVASQIITSLQTIVSRRIDPLDPVVLSFGTIQGGYNFNVIADKVEMTGTVRTFNPTVREQIPQLMEQTIQGICSAYGADYKFDYEKYFPATINEERMTRIAQEAATKIVGEDQVLVEKRPSMGGEDFAIFAQHVPGTFIRMGIKNWDKGITFPMHHPRFDVDEDVLFLTAAVLAQGAWDFLHQKQ